MSFTKRNFQKNCLQTNGRTWQLFSCSTKQMKLWKLFPFVQVQSAYRKSSCLSTVYFLQAICSIYILIIFFFKLLYIFYLKGNLIHDSHAEVLARRCFMRFLYHELQAFVQNSDYQSEMFVKKEKYKFDVKENLEFLLFTSHVPCKYSNL